MLAGIFGRIFAWGVGGGSILGLVYGPISLLTLEAISSLTTEIAGGTGLGVPSLNLLASRIVPAAIVGLVLGSLIGVIIGIIDGILLGVIVGFVLFSQDRIHAYREILGIICSLSGIFVAVILIIASGWPARLSSTSFLAGWTLWIIIPIVMIAGLVWLTRAYLQIMQPCFCKLVRVYL